MGNLVRYANDVSKYNIDDRIDRLFDTVFGGTTSSNIGIWSPAADIMEDDNRYTIKAELPGIKKEEVKITINNNILTLKGERKHEKETKGKYTHRTERFYGDFTRSFSLPNEVETEKISADYKDGVLEISLPKSERSKPKEIEVKIAN